MRACDRTFEHLFGRICNWLRLLPLLLGALPAMAAEPQAPLLLASLRWPPYVGPEIAGGGLAQALVRSAARKAGYHLKVEYFPWNRTVRLGGKDPRYAGFFPAYYTEERARQCHFSTALGTSTLVLAHLRKHPVRWQQLTDLAAKKIGVVVGYSNGAQFDAMVQRGTLNVDPSPSDLLNLRKLFAQRVDAVVIDRLVLRYLLLSDPDLHAHADEVTFHERPVAELSLHVCFQRNAQGRRLQHAFNAALRTIPLPQFEREYMRTLEQRTGTE
jgi:polar amino acid transport system substrate-binding protein